MSRLRPLVLLTFGFLSLGCADLPTLEGTRCREPEISCGGGLGCLGGVCLALKGGPIVCDSHDACRQADPRRPFCVGTQDDRVGVADTYQNNFCAGCGSDSDCTESVCVQGETNWFCIGCLDGTQCETGRCDENVCRSCKGDGQCASGKCEDGRCLECKADPECDGTHGRPATHLCRAGVCRACVSDPECCGPGRKCSEWTCSDRRCQHVGGER